MSILNHVIALLNASRFADARLILDKLIAKNSHSPVLFRLRATCLFKDGDIDSALIDLNRTISLGMVDGEILLNKARLYLRLNQIDNSVDLVLEALLQRDKYFFDALNFYLGELYQRAGKGRHAAVVKDVHRLVTASDASTDESKLLKCSLFIKVGDVGNAKRVWQSVTEKNKRKSLLLRAQLFRLQGHLDDAIEVFCSLTEDTNDFAIFHSLANCYYDKGLLKLAADNYQQAIHHNPHYAESHYNFAQTMFELGEHSQMFDTYNQYFNTHSASNEIALPYIELLLRLALLDQLKAALISLKKSLSESEFHYLSAEYHRLKNDFDSIAFHVARCEPEHLSAEQNCQLIQCCILIDDIERAKVMLDYVLHHEPTHQWALALHLFLEQNESNNSSNVSINDYVYTAFIKPPDNFSSLDNYLDALCDLLKPQHNSSHSPFDQTLHYGTQTHGELFHLESPLIQHLKSEFHRCALDAKRFFESLPSLYEGFNNSYNTIKDVGSWSVILKKDGYHNDHIHPMGFLSSVCYLHLPSDISPENGSLRFGCPPFATTIDAKIRVVVPARGMIALFPSCCWHGTVPLLQESSRITAAADFIFE